MLFFLLFFLVPMHHDMLIGACNPMVIPDHVLKKRKKKRLQVRAELWRVRQLFLFDHFPLFFRSRATHAVLCRVGRWALGVGRWALGVGRWARAPAAS